MERRKANIFRAQEAKGKGSKVRSIGGGFKLSYYGLDRREGA